MKSFITGSHAYGTPSSKSDIDLVIRCSEETKSKLAKMSDLGKYPIRFGKLNIVACTTDEEWAVWLAGTRSCQTYDSPMDKEAATTVLDDLKASVGIPAKRERDSGR